MEQEEKISLIAEDFPIILEIKNRNTAEKVADVWLETIRLSPWERIADMPFSNKFPDRSLKEHVNATTEAALAVSRIFKKYHGIEVDEDLLIAFGLIHDVDKALKYIPGENGDIIISEMGSKIPHGIMSAMIARDCGFGMKMQHLLITHTPSQNMEPAYKEGLVFAGVDKCDWDLVCRFLRES